MPFSPVPLQQAALCVASSSIDAVALLVPDHEGDVGEDVGPESPVVHKADAPEFEHLFPQILHVIVVVQPRVVDRQLLRAALF